MRVIGYVRVVRSYCASAVMCESKCASGPVIMCEGT